MKEDLIRTSIQQAFDQKGWIRLSKGLIRSFGLDAAVIIGALVDKDAYWSKHKKQFERLTSQKYNGEFFAVRDDIKKYFGISAYRQREVEKILQKNLIIKVTRRGIPNKNYYKIDYEQLFYHLMVDDYEYEDEIDT